METSFNHNDYIRIKELAGLFFSPSEIALMLGLDVSEFTRQFKITGSDIYNAYHGGRLESEMLFRKKVFELAVKAGSSPAQTLVNNFITNSAAKR